MESIYNKLAKAMDKLSASQVKEFQESRRKGELTPEQQLHCVEAILAKNVKESVRKNNGRADNGGEEFRESNRGAEQITESQQRIVNCYLKHGKSLEEARVMAGLPPKTYAGLKLNSSERRIFDGCIKAGRQVTEALFLAAPDTAERLLKEALKAKKSVPQFIEELRG